KYVVLGLIFLKYISDRFELKHSELLSSDHADDAEERDFYTAENIFWVPAEARYKAIQDRAKQPTVGAIIDNAMDAIERENPTLRGVLPKNYAREALDKRRLGELIDLVGNIKLH